MWQKLGILLIAAGIPAVALADEFSAGGPVVMGQAEVPPGTYAQGPAMPGFQSGMMPGEQPVYPAEVAAAGCEPGYYGPGGSFMRPCFLDDYWDFTGSRSPTDYACWNGYGPDWCHTWNARVEWLMWFSQSRDLPVIAETFDVVGGAPVNPTPVFADDEIGERLRHGARVTIGRYLGDSPVRAEGRFWGLEDGSERLVVTSNDNPNLAITLTNAFTGLEFPIVISSPGVLANGSIDILAKNDLIGADAWLRGTWWDDGVFRLDGLTGYQFTRMDDSVTVRAESTRVATFQRTRTQDLFIANNEFHGGSVGLVMDWRKDALSLELLGKLALGNMRQRALIEGSGVATVGAGAPTPLPSGVLVQATNEGEFTANRFTVVPELNANVIIHLNPAWRIVAGYSLLYLDQVKLAGDQIDLRIGAGFPRFPNRETTFYVQGMNLGLDYRW